MGWITWIDYFGGGRRSVVGCTADTILGKEKNCLRLWEERCFTPLFTVNFFGVTFHYIMGIVDNLVHGIDG